MGGSSGAKLGSRARAPSRARGDSGRERRRSPELRRVTGRGRSPCRRVAQSQVRFKSPARGVAETRTQSQGQQENRAPEIPMEVRTISVTAQEEAAPREPDGTRPAEPAGEPGKDTEMAQCTVCGEPQRCLKKHVHAIHLPWFWMLMELPKERRTQVSGARLVQGPATKPTREWWWMAIAIWSC